MEVQIRIKIQRKRISSDSLENILIFSCSDFLFNEILIPILISYLGKISYFRKELVCGVFALCKSFAIVKVADNNGAVVNLKFLI